MDRWVIEGFLCVQFQKLHKVGWLFSNSAKKSVWNIYIYA